VRQEAVRALGKAIGDEAQNVLIERLRGDDPTLWAPCAAVLERQGWMPFSSADRVRWCAARGRWAMCLELGDENDAISEIRHVLRVGDDLHRRGAVATLRKLGWRPTEPTLEFLQYYAARVPPLVITRAECDRIVETLGRALQALAID
jgi:hypothetical protein